MIKNIEWLKKEIWKQDIVMNKGYIYTDDLMSIINEVDEPEVLSQEWIDKNSVNASSDGVTEEYVHVDDLENLIVPKQELPAIPKYVADWITEHNTVFDLYPALKKLEDKPAAWKPWKRIYEWYRMNTHQFVNAYLTGEYVVEDEPLYYALIKGHELITDEGDWTRNHWNLNIANGNVYLNDRFSRDGKNLTRMSKEDWSEYGINETNAEFRKVGEV